MAHNPIEYEWGQYFGHLKALVSSTMIDAAIKIRMLQDYAEHEDEDFNSKGQQANACAGLSIGKMDSSDASLMLRESCNKIIHATGARLEWQAVGEGDDAFEYWNGVYRLFGAERSGKQWVVTVNVPDWCTAMMRYSCEFQLSIDWSRVLKWDE